MNQKSIFLVDAGSLVPPKTKKSIRPISVPLQRCLLSVSSKQLLGMPRGGEVSSGAGQAEHGRCAGGAARGQRGRDAAGVSRARLECGGWRKRGWDVAVEQSAAGQARPAAGGLGGGAEHGRAPLRGEGVQALLVMARLQQRSGGERRDAAHRGTARARASSDGMARRGGRMMRVGKKRREEEEEVEGEESDTWVLQEDPVGVKNNHINPHLYPYNQTKNWI
jgi:hypothetical protein